MQPLRRQIHVVWLALFALALQLALSFGHVHHRGLDRQQAAFATANAFSDVAPGSSQDDDDDEAHCAICWSVALAGTVILPSPPVAPTLPLVKEPFTQHAQVESVRSARPASFQARAPPADFIG